MLKLLLLLVGILFLVVEFYTEGFGVIGIASFSCITASIILSSQSVTQAIVLMLVFFVLFAMVIYFSFVFFSRKSNGVILNQKESVEEGYIAKNADNSIIGKSGITITDLRPCGAITLDGNKVDVMTSGEYISKNTMVEIIQVSGAKVLVKKEEK